MNVPSNSIGVLHVDDEPDFADLAGTFLEREDDRLAVSTATSAAEGLEHLADDGVDCVVSDYNMPGTNGLEFLREVRAARPDLPFILFTGRGSEEIASEAITSGVTDYLQKGSGTEQYELLANRIGNAVQQYRAERTAEESERRLLEIAENTNDVLWMFSRDWSELLFINSAYEDIWGRSVETLEATPTDFLKGVVPAHRPRVEAAMERLSRGESVDFEYRVNPAEDFERWVWVQGYPIVDGTGAVVRVVGFARDVTGRKEHERRLSALHETTRSLMRADSPRDVADLATDAARDVLGLSVNSVFLYEADRDALVPAAHTPAVEALIDDVPVFERGEGYAWEVYETGEVRTFEDVGSDPDAYNPGTDVRSELILPLGDYGVFLASSTTVGEFDERTVTLAKVLTANVETALDRTRRHRRLRAREDRIQRLQERTRGLIRASSRTEIAEVAVDAARTTLDLPFSGVHLLDDEGERLVPVAATDEVRERFGAAPTYERTAPPESADSVVWGVFEGGDPLVLADVRDHEPITGADTPTRSGIVQPLGRHGVFNTTSPEPDAFDDTDVALTKILSALVTAALDRTEREEDLRGRTERLEYENERLEEFTGIVSHDLQNPLNVAVGRLDLVRAECDSAHLDDVERAHDRMTELIENLLELARKGEVVTDLAAVDLATAVERCWRCVETADADLVVATDRVVLADEGRLRQLLENLLANAVRHGGSDVTVTVGDLADGFFLADDGPGIPEEARADVFEVGYTTGEGTGFGLSIVERIADAHDWAVTATEGADGGTRFEITGVGLAEE